MLKQTFSKKMDIKPEETKVDSLGECRFDHPHLKGREDFELANKHVLVNPFIDKAAGLPQNSPTFEIASPQKKIYFKPGKVRAAVVTCGGICPGLNNVIRSIVLCLHHNYDCEHVFGFQSGFQGFIKKYQHEVLKLTPDFVSPIHNIGGTVLGTSRGPQEVSKIVDTLEELGINQLYCIGGDGTLRAAEEIAKETAKRKLTIAIVGIPKTIDNDIPLSSESFGFDTSVEEASKAIRCSHVEAKSNYNGIGLVKLMGRNSGFIAAIASLSQRDVNFVLIPEHDFDLTGPKGLLAVLKKRMIANQHAVIVVAEGAGQKLLPDTKLETDPSGNKALGDIGVFLRDQIVDYFKQEKMIINLKYIDPSYMIRSTNSNTHDNLFAATLGQNAVHAVMAGKTKLMISIWHGVYCYIPLRVVNQRVKRLSLKGRVWMTVLESTGQPDFRN